MAAAGEGPLDSVDQKIGTAPTSTATTLSSKLSEYIAGKTAYSADDLFADYSGGSGFRQKKPDGTDDDPTSAKYFNEFMKDPIEENKRLKDLRENARKTLTDEEYFSILRSNSHHELKKGRRFDFRLDAAELDKYKKNGFVVSERLAVESFAEAYYRTYTDDLPVFVSADSILHAWHMSFSELLQEVEEKCLRPTLLTLLTKMHEELSRVSPSEPLVSVDYFLSVALSLLSGKTWPSRHGNEEKIRATLSHIEGLSTMDVLVFGECRREDFSQFKPRGHYEKSAALSEYFRAMMWLGRIDFRLCQGTESSRKQLEASLSLLHLVKVSGQESLFMKFNRLLENLVGETDSLDLCSFSRIVEHADVLEKLSSASPEQVERLENVVANQAFGIEQIQSHVEWEECKTPRSLCFVGQKFTLDAYVFSNVTFDRIEWRGEKVQRRRPSGLDVAFSVFGNDAATKEIVRRIKSDDGASWRDGKNYAHQLASLRLAIDGLPESCWTRSIYSLWLHALRALSAVPTERRSGLFRSEAWGNRVLSAQLGSWCELKHDTVLYAKQAYGCTTCCEYPEGLVEPVPEFFKRMGSMSRAMQGLLKDLDLYSEEEDRPRWMATMKDKHQGFLQRFSQIMSKLEIISNKQNTRIELMTEEKDFLLCVMEERRGSGATRYLGWYPHLFYGGRETSGEFKPRVADVFTAPADSLVGDRGGILHVGTGKVLQAIIAVDGIAYAGPVFSYYEFEKEVDCRLGDKEWERMIKRGKEPPLPGWATGSYLQSV